MTSYNITIPYDLNDFPTVSAFIDYISLNVQNEFRKLKLGRKVKDKTAEIHFVKRTLIEVIYRVDNIVRISAKGRIKG